MTHALLASTTRAKKIASAALPVRPAIGAGLLQRKCSAGSEGECDECRRKHVLQRRPSGPEPGGAANTGQPVPASVQRVLSTGGSPLDAGARERFEPLFGHDFGQVRVHTDVAAAQSARSVNALAYTVGQHVVFGSGRYDTASQAGRGLLAHELAHTVQQRGAGGSLQRLSMDDSGGPMEREAEDASQRVMRGEPARVALSTGNARVQGFTVTTEAAGGCGICYDTAYPGKGPQNAGRVAHGVVQGAFDTLLGGVQQFGRLTEMAFSAPGDENGRLDLVRATPTGLEIGEIKPATPHGELQGMKDLAWYFEMVQAAFPLSTVTPLMTRIPVGAGLRMPDELARSAGCPEQMLAVIMMRPGLYGYFCEPPYSVARRGCTCRKRKEKKVPQPEDVPVTADKKSPAGEKEGAKAEDGKKDGKKGEKDGEKEGGRAIPPMEPVPEAARVAGLVIAAGLLARLLSKIGPKAILSAPLKRALVAVTALAALTLWAKGAEASVGLDGEDPIETLLKNADAKGQHLPDDIKDALRKDPELKALLEKAARSGNFDEAKRAQAEQLTRLIAGHRDEFSEEELETLLQVTEHAKGSLPDGDLTVEQIKKSIEAKRRGVAPGAGGDSPPPATGSAVTPAAPEKPAEPEAQSDPAPSAPAGASRTPAERLVEGMARPAEGGPKFTASVRQKLLDLARSLTPPLSEAEVDQLLDRLGSAVGKTEDEVVETLRQGVMTLRAKPGADAGDTPADDTGAPETAPAADPAGGGGLSQQIDKADPNAKPSRSEQENIALYAKTLDSIGWILPGDSYLSFNKPPYVAGRKYWLLHVGRDSDGVPFAGVVEVTILAQKGARWQVEVARGQRLYTVGRRYGTTRRYSEWITPPAGALKPTKKAMP
ncbi:DUF4157 domain-containing protein [Xylophilus sp. GOD-11R]|uniref:eCIS core domain-containing protein n=1 Tax=Xylophilus sp. GOD-11R TaxID=3089814 RepID=UPI00298C775D|nr:DUF4157 domain-containing protein [Xylophilus sp. GOD-11R]WPB55028.1 DUF4157 domain-containing protein [Xylophilus sp. GOD-11R]